MLDARQKSLEVLGLSENSSDTEIKKRYQELYEDYNIRLTNAPTPALKKLYQKNLQEIEDAYSAFKLEDNPKEKTHETTLPSSRPSAAANTNESIHTRNQPEVRAGKNFNGPQANNEQLNQKKTPSQGGISVNIFIGVTVALLALATFGIMLYFQGKKEIEAMEKEQAENAELLQLKPVLKNGKLKIENQLTKEVAIVGLRVTYLNEKNVLERFVGEDIVYVLPGKSVDLDYYKGGKLLWDGSVLSYGLIVYSIDPDTKIPLVPIHVYSGIWLHEWKENKLVITR